MSKPKLEKFDELVECFGKLPGVGKKSALKYAYHAALGDPFLGLNLAHTIEDAVRFLRRCERCGAISENEICDICADEGRERETLLVVGDPKDVLTIENSGSYGGLYFVFENTERIDALRENIARGEVREVIFAFTPGLGGDALMLFIESELAGLGLKFTKIAQGIPTGVSLDNVDMLSLSKAIKDRNGI